MVTTVSQSSRLQHTKYPFLWKEFQFCYSHFLLLPQTKHCEGLLTLWLYFMNYVNAAAFVLSFSKFCTRSRIKHKPKLTPKKLL